MNDVASLYKPCILSIFICWHEAGEHGEDEIHSQLYRKPVPKAGPLPCLPIPECADGVAQGRQLLARVGKGDPLLCGDGHITLLIITFTYPAGFLWGGVWYSSPQVAPAQLWSTDSQQWWPHGWVLPSAILRSQKPAASLACSVLSCSHAANCRKLSAGGKTILGRPCRANVLPPPGSCWEVGFQNHLLWLKIQERACQPLHGNYSRLICTFSVCIQVEA